MRYLSFVVSTLGSTDAAIHNFLLTLYAIQSTPDETALLAFLKNEVKRIFQKKGGGSVYTFDFYARGGICITIWTMPYDSVAKTADPKAVCISIAKWDSMKKQ